MDYCQTKNHKESLVMKQTTDTLSGWYCEICNKYWDHALTS